MVPSYLKDLLRLQTNNRYKLRSKNTIALVVPKKNFKSQGDRAFSTASTRLWNKLLIEIRKSKSVDMFKSISKVYLFDNYFNV